MGLETTPTLNRPNECDVITIFPMGVKCFVQNPSTDRTFDGAAVLAITGGTPPYTISWDVGGFSPALTNLGVGEYGATIIDSYGDFTANTVCVLTAETTSISGMCFVVTGIVGNELVYVTSENIGLKNGRPSYFLQYGIQELGYVFWNQATGQWYFCQSLDCQSGPYNVFSGDTFYPSALSGQWEIASDTQLQIVESYVGFCFTPVGPTQDYELCFSIESLNQNIEIPGLTVEQINFDPSVDINGKQSWTSVTSQYLLYWNTGSTPSQWTITGYNPTTIFINNDPTYPPLSNWQTLGNANITSVNMVEGNCGTGYTVFTTAIDNDALCGGLGSITVTASGGISPYSYSVDGGSSYQASPIFNNLNPGIYSVTTKDSNDVVGNSINVTISNNLPTLYNLTLLVNFSNNTFSITAPTLPGGVTLSVDLFMTSIFTFYPVGIIPAPNYNNFTTIDGAYQMVLTNVTTNVVPISGPCTADNPISGLQIQKTFTSTLNFTSNQTITGTTTNSIINPPVGACENAVGYYYFNMTNPSVSGCDCCQLNLINPTIPTPPQI